MKYSCFFFHLLAVRFPISFHFVSSPPPVHSRFLCKGLFQPFCSFASNLIYKFRFSSSFMTKSLWPKLLPWLQLMVTCSSSLPSWSSPESTATDLGSTFSTWRRSFYACFWQPVSLQRIFQAVARKRRLGAIAVGWASRCSSPCFSPLSCIWDCVSVRSSTRVHCNASLLPERRAYPTYVFLGVRWQEDHALLRQLGKLHGEGS